MLEDIGQTEEEETVNVSNSTRGAREESKEYGVCADEDAEAAQDDANEDPQSLMLDNGGISFNDGIEVNEDEEFEDIVVQEQEGLLPRGSNPVVDKRLRDLDSILNVWDQQDCEDQRGLTAAADHGFELQAKYVDDRIFRDMRHSLQFLLN